MSATIQYEFLTYEKCQDLDETAYLNLCHKILNEGILRPDRTGIGTWALFGERLLFNLRGQIPVLTTKKFAWKTMCKELLWFISGSTNSNKLVDKGVKIWQANTTREI